MTRFDDRLEKTEARMAEEMDASIAALSAALHGEGTALCVGCGNPIEEKRRQAMPSAKRCFECQTFYEAEKYHR